MEKECRNCREKYNFCVSCVLTRPYIQRFCSLKCKLEFEEKQKNETNKENGGSEESNEQNQTNIL